MSCSKSFKDIQVGDSATFTKTIAECDVYNYAGIVGDFNPVHINADEAKNSPFGQRIAHGMLSVGLISTILGTELPGPGTLYLGQEVKFLAPVFFGDTVTAECKVIEKREDKNIAKLATIVRKQDGTEVVTGVATVMKKE